MDVLVIDDDAAVREIFALALRGVASRVRTAADGETGVALAREHKPDLVFLDLRMPGIDGVETLRLLSRLYPDIKVYIVTAFAQEFLASLDAARREGLVFQLAAKPLRPDQIAEIARSAAPG